jgi:YjbE family integral membrane protein
MLGDATSPLFWAALLEIVGINILLSGDNAVVIALASRSLPDHQRNMAVIGGSAAAVVLRVIFCLVIVQLMAIPYLQLAGGILLLYIGVKLMIPEDDADEDSVAAKSHLWGAIQTIVVADAVMSLDNVVAIAAAAKNNVTLIVLGLLISIPMIIFGSQLLLRVLTRFPVLVTAGAGLLGWIAGEIVTEDRAVRGWIAMDPHLMEAVAKPLGAVFVVAVGTLLARRHKVAEKTG